MRKDATEVVNALKMLISNAGGMPRTFDWEDFMERCGRISWREAFASELQEEAIEAGLIIGYGSEAVIVASDTNFAPITDRP